MEMCYELSRCILYSRDYGNSWLRHDGVSAEKDKYVEDTCTMFFWNEHTISAEVLTGIYISGWENNVY